MRLSSHSTQGSLASPHALEAETLAFASGLITPRSGSWSAVAEVVRFHSKANAGPLFPHAMRHLLPFLRKVHPNWTWGRLPSPPTPNAKLTKEEATRTFRRWLAGLLSAHPDTACTKVYQLPARRCVQGTRRWLSQQNQACAHLKAADKWRAEARNLQRSHRREDRVDFSPACEQNFS